MSGLRYSNGIADTLIDSQLLRSYRSNPQTMLYICPGKIGLFSSFLFSKTGWMSLTIFTGQPTSRRERQRDLHREGAEAFWNCRTA